MEHKPQCVNSSAEKSLDQALSDYSPKDAKWDRDRAVTQSMSEFLFQMQRFERWAERMDGCTRTLGLGEVINSKRVKSIKDCRDVFANVVIALCVMGVNLWCVWDDLENSCQKLSKNIRKLAGLC